METAVAAAILTNPENKLETDANGRVTFNNAIAIADQLLANPANKLATDDAGRVTFNNVVVGGGGGGGDVSIDALAPALARVIARLTSRVRDVSVDLVLVRGTTWRIPLDTLPPGWSRLEATARRVGCDDQSRSLFHVFIDGDPANGLKIWNGSPTQDPSAATLEIVDGVPVITITAETSAELPTLRQTPLCYDAKVWAAGNVTQVANGSIDVVDDVTRI